MKPQWLWLIAVPLLAALLYTFQRAEQGETAQPAEVATLPRYTLTGATLVRYDSDGAATLRGTASSVEYFDDDSRRAADLDADLLSDNEVTWHLKSPTATMPPKDRRFLLEGPVVATGNWPDSGDALTATTTQVWVDPDARLFDTAQPVQLDSAARNGHAVGMRVDWQEHRLQLLHNVKMIYVAAP